jgi:hypothetical protein
MGNAFRNKAPYCNAGYRYLDSTEVRAICQG